MSYFAGDGRDCGVLHVDPLSVLKRKALGPRILPIPIHNLPSAVSETFIERTEVIGNVIGVSQLPPLSSEYVTFGSVLSLQHAMILPERVRTAESELADRNGVATRTGALHVSPPFVLIACRTLLESLQIIMTADEERAIGTASETRVES